MTSVRFREELVRLRPDLDLRFAEHGMILGDTEDWPGTGR
jgi:hypothetical protein